MLSGAQQGKDRQLNYDPCALSYYGDGEYIVMGGSDKKVHMYTKDGVFLKTMAEKEDWVWAVKARPKHKYVVCRRGRLFHTQHENISTLDIEEYFRLPTNQSLWPAIYALSVL